MIKKSYEIIKNPAIFLKFNLLLLYGENDGLKKDIKKIIQDNLNKTDKNTEIISLQESIIINDTENFYNSIYSGSLFSKKKIIIINEATDKITEHIKKIIEKHPENVFFFILAEQLEKRSKLRNLFETNEKILCIPCYFDSERDLETITKNEFKKNNISLSQELLNLLIEKSNGNRNNLRNEIEKIKLFSINKKKIEINEIKSIINFSGEYKLDNLINECLCGNTLHYKKILSELYTNTINQVFLLRIASNKIQRLLSIKKNLNNYNGLDSLLNATRPPIFWKEKPMVKKQLTIWSLEELKLIINEINSTEILCKKNPLISKLIFFEFFNKICKKANSYL